MEKIAFAFLSLLIVNLVLTIYKCPQNNMPYNLLHKQDDGPYVHYKGDQILVKYIIAEDGKKKLKTDSIPFSQKADLILKVMTDIPGKSFRVLLKKGLQNETSEFPMVKKLVVLSDIEGNFTALRKLLVASRVIDEDLNWKFGEGNLVLNGDFFDRGHQVTEVLWLIYYLEDKAKAAGGYIHFILGNHEIMNLSGDLRYLPQKYLDNAGLLKEKYENLYDENSELGRWLRTKNILEKIGDIVFVHGGISGSVNKMNLNIPDINILTRPYYADSTSNYKDKRLDTILGDMGPFWYRGYYEKNDPGILAEINNTLRQFGANHIITGHTIVSNMISVWYDGKLLNTDLPHAQGKSEALLIENDKFYRVNTEGKKVLLMQSD